MTDQYGITPALNRWLDEAAVKYLDEVSIEKLKLSDPNLRLAPLLKAGISTVGKAYHYSPRAMENLPGMGSDSVRAVKKAAREYISEARKEVALRLDPEQQSPAETRLVQGIYRELRGKNSAAKVPVPDAQEAWRDFRIHAADYYAVMDQYDPFREERMKSSLPEEIAKAVMEQETDLSYFSGTPRTYQLFGIKYGLYEKRSLLGDEMGLGKTIQALGMIAHLYAKGRRRFLVICPASVLINWQREAEKFVSVPGKEIPAYIFHGQDIDQDIHPWMEEGGIGVTNYESLSRLLELWNGSLKVDLTIVDEAHYIKNPGAARTVLAGKVLGLSEYALLMTGTPLENKVDEMCQLVELIRPEFAEELRKMAAYDKATGFEKKAAPVYLRRTREDVLQELPELMEEDAWVELSKEERKQYRQSVMAGNFMAMRQLSWELKDPKESCKAQRLQEICQEARENGRKVIVFSFFRNTLAKVKELLGDAAMEPINGSVPVGKRQAILDAFAAVSLQEEPAGEEVLPHVLPCQVISGGMGLNIQSASVVIFCEPQIKPSLETQAISRAYRMGQSSSVLVFRLYAKDTVDEQIREILMDKQAVFDEYADPSAVGEESLQEENQNTIRKMVEQEQMRMRIEIS